MATIIWIGIVMYEVIRSTYYFHRSDIFVFSFFLCADILTLCLGVAIYHYFIAGA